MQSITLYPPDGRKTYEEPTDLSVDNGTLRFHSQGKRIVTTVPFWMEEDLAAVDRAAPVKKSNLSTELGLPY